MNFRLTVDPPVLLETIQQKTSEMSFGMGSDVQTGALLRTLVATKPGGRFLELGTGTGLATAWMLDGMDSASHLTSIESDQWLFDFAVQVFQRDARASFILGDGGEFLQQTKPQQFDLIFADAWPGKYSYLEEAIETLKPGGIYVIDDMSPQPNWPDGHQARVDELVDGLEKRSDLRLTKLDWSTGVIIAAKTI